MKSLGGATKLNLSSLAFLVFGIIVGTFLMDKKAIVEENNENGKVSFQRNVLLILIIHPLLILLKCG